MLQVDVPYKKREIMITYTINEWIDEGKKRFGENVKQWKFVYPQCKTVQTIQELLQIIIYTQTER